MMSIYQKVRNRVHLKRESGGSKRRAIIQECINFLDIIIIIIIPLCERSKTSWGIEISKRTFQEWSLLILAVRRRFMPFFACTIIRSNIGYRLVISIFCRCRSGPHFPFTTASDIFSSSLNVRSKSRNLFSFEISLSNYDFCRPKARFIPLMTCCTSGTLRAANLKFSSYGSQVPRGPRKSWPNFKQ